MFKRRTIRLPPALHDYRGGAWYFVTLCTKWRVRLFATAEDFKLSLTNVGQIVSEEWLYVGRTRPNVTLDEFVVMPEHMHAIIGLIPAQRLTDEVRWPHGPASGSLGAVLKQFKSRVQKRVGRAFPEVKERVWQRGYHERVIRRGSGHLEACRRYIRENPRRYLVEHGFAAEVTS